MDGRAMASWSARGSTAGAALLLLGALLVLPGPASAQARLASDRGVAPQALAPAGVTAPAADDPATVDPSAPTWAKDVAPILYQNCVRCHNPNGIGPMSLIPYDVARRYAPLIKFKVVNRLMPPWLLDRDFGIRKYKNDVSLSDEQIRTISRWVDAGAPEGDPSKAPSPPKIVVGDHFRLEAKLGPPDFVVKAPPYTVRPNSQDQWWTPSQKFEGYIKEPRYVKATELQGSYPLGMRVTHHGHATLVWRENGETVSRPLGREGVGKGGDLFSDGTAMRIAPEGTVHWSLHYFPIDVPVPDERARAAVWLYPKGYKPEYETVGEQRFEADHCTPASHPGGIRPDWGCDIAIPPHSYKTMQGFHVLPRPALITSFRPHMHMRGKEQSVEAILPNGVREALSKVNRYNHFWQISYEYADDVAPLLPKGTVLVITSTFDNTDANPINPDPDQWVVFGQRGVDEMSHVWLGMTYLTQEQYDRLKARREQKMAAARGGRLRE